MARRATCSGRCATRATSSCPPFGASRRGRMKLPRWPLWRWTVTHQILILVAVSVLAAQVSGLIVALTLPQRPLPGVAIEQAGARIRDAVRHVSAAQQGVDAEHEAREA